MSSELITEKSERVKSFFLSMDRISLALERMFSSRKPTLSGESFYTDEELSKKLKNQPEEFTGLPQRRAHPIHQVRREDTLSFLRCGEAVGRWLSGQVQVVILHPTEYFFLFRLINISQ